MAREGPLAERASPEFELHFTSWRLTTGLFAYDGAAHLASHGFLTYHHVAPKMMGAMMGAIKRG